MTPLVRCFMLMEAGDDRLDVQNSCSEPIEITPADCEEPCDETLRVEPNSDGFLELATPDKDGVQKAFVYKQSDQTGTIDFTYSLNDCSTEDGCSATVTRGGTSGFSLSALLIALVILATRRLLVR